MVGCVRRSCLRFQYLNLVLSTGSCIYVAAIEMSIMDGHGVHLGDVPRVFPFVCDFYKFIPGAVTIIGFFVIFTSLLVSREAQVT